MNCYEPDYLTQQHHVEVNLASVVECYLAGQTDCYLIGWNCECSQQKIGWSLDCEPLIGYLDAAALLLVGVCCVMLLADWLHCVMLLVDGLD